MFFVFKINSINIIILIWCEELSNIERVTLTSNKYNIIVICLLLWVYNNLYTIYWDIALFFLFYIFINMILIYQYYFIFFYNFDFLIKLNIN